MQSWLINIILITLVLVVIFIFPFSTAKGLLSIGVIATSIWAYLDAKKLDIKKYQNKGFFVFRTPLEVLIGCWFFWIIAFPLYISYRKKILDGKIPLKIIPSSTPPTSE